MADAGDYVGKVSAIEGRVTAKGTDGTIRVLKLGDPVYEGDVIQTPEGGRVELALNDGVAYFLRDKETVTLDEMVLGGRIADAREGALMPGSLGELEDISRAIAEGSSLDRLLEETAAGRPALFGRVDDGHSFVQLLRIAEAIDPLGYKFATREGGQGDDGGRNGAGATDNTANDTADSTEPAAPVAAANDATTIGGDTSAVGAEDTAITGTLTASDADGLLDGTVFGISAAAAHGTASIDPATGAWSYTPVADWHGADSFTVTVTDDEGNATTQVVSLTVNAVVDITNDSVSTTEDSPVTIAVLANDSFEGTPTVTAVGAAGHGSVAINPDGTLGYTPDANFHGTDSFSYTVTSPTGITETATVSVTVTAANDATTIGGDTSAVGAEDTAITGTLTASDADGLLDGTVFGISAAAAHGTASIDPATGAWSYTPVADWHGADSFTVTVTDDEGNATTQVVSLTVNAVVDITNDSVSTTEDSPVTIAVLANDNFEGTPTVTAVGAAGHGSVAINPDGTLSYTPDANFHGTDSFSYTVTSPTGITETATVSVTVTAANDATTIGGDTSAVGAEDTAITGTLTASDADGLLDGTIFGISAAAAHGTASIDPATGAWSYTPVADWHGADSFTVTVTDDEGNATTQVVSLTVNAVVDITNDSVSTTEDSPVTIAVLANDSFEGTPTVTAVGAAGHGSVAINPDGTLSYTPDANFHGTDSFSYTVTSPAGITETATVSVTVTAANDATTIGGDTSAVGAEDTAITGTLTASDADGLLDGTVFGISAAAAHGTASIDPATGAWSYTPVADWHGADSFTVTVTDDEGNATTQVVSLTVNAVVDITNDSVSTTEDSPVTISVLANDSFEGTPTVTAVGAAGHGSVAINPDGTLSYTPDANFHGTDSFSYTVTSPTGITETATVSVTVTAANDATTIGGDTSAVGAEDTAITGTLTASDADGLLDGTVFGISAAAAHGTATIDPATGAWSYTPVADWHGADSFTVTVTDDEGNATTQVVSLTVNAVVDITNDSVSTTEDSPVTIAVLANDSFEGTPTVTAVGAAGHGSVAINPDGTLSYTPDANFHGTDSFSYTVTSPTGITETATVSVTVTAANDATTIGGDTSAVGAEDTASPARSPPATPTACSTARYLASAPPRRTAPPASTPPPVPGATPRWPTGTAPTASR
jgi:VCBS repeat-containing protein